MARIRSLKLGFFQNEQLCDLSPFHRLLFAGLWLLADREGRLEDRPRRIKVQLFPYDDLDVDAMLTDLAHVQFVIRYVIDGAAYLAIPHFLKHQRPKTDEYASVIPAPVCDIPRGIARRPHLDRETETDREIQTQTRRADLETRFERFWECYPRKVGKDAARREFHKLAPDNDFTDQLIAAVSAHKASTQWRKDGGEFIPHARTWLHQGRWKDELQPGGPSQPVGPLIHGLPAREWNRLNPFEQARRAGLK